MIFWFRCLFYLYELEIYRKSCSLSSVYLPDCSFARLGTRVWFILGVTLRRDRCMFFGSSCPGFGRWGIFQVGSCFDLTPSFLGHFLTFWHHRMFLANRVRSLGQPWCCLFLRGPPFLSLENATYNRDLFAAATLHCFSAFSLVIRVPLSLPSVSDPTTFCAWDKERQILIQKHDLTSTPGRQSSILLITPRASFLPLSCHRSRI